MFNIGVMSGVSKVIIIIIDIICVKWLCLNKFWINVLSIIVGVVLNKFWVKCKK